MPIPLSSYSRACRLYDESVGSNFDDRRAHTRFPIRLPVRVTLFTAPLVHREGRNAQPSGAAPEPIVIQAMALDVSERGFKLEISGESVKAILDSSDPLVGLEVGFMHDELRSVGARAGHVQWRRAGSDRNTWSLGARLDKALSAEDLTQILRCSTSVPRPRRAGLLVVGVASLVGALAWYGAYANGAAERDTSARRFATIEGELARLRREVDRCRASLDALAAAAATSPPAPATASVASVARDAAAGERTAGALGSADASGELAATDADSGVGWPQWALPPPRSLDDGGAGR